MSTITRLASIVAIAVAGIGVWAVVGASASAASAGASASAASFTTQLPPLTCHSLRTGLPFEKTVGARSVVKAQQTCAASGNIVPISVCLQDSKTGTSYWHTAACRARNARFRGRTLTVTVHCSPAYFRTLSIYSDLGTLDTTASAVIGTDCR